MGYELRRYDYAPLGDGEYEVASWASDIVNIVYDCTLDRWWRGEGKKARYYIWDTETQERIEVDDAGVEVEPLDLFLYAVEGGLYTKDEAKSLALFLGYTEDDFEEICKGLIPYDFAEEADNDND